MPTVYDRTLAPEGKHVVSLFTQWVPHEWSEKPHTEELDAYADRVIAGYDELAPGFADSVLHRQVIGPCEMEHEWGLIGGNIFHGELSAEQLFHMRPAPGYADYRSPIRGLYQASSATHGGGGVCGIPGLQRVPTDRARTARRAPHSRTCTEGMTHACLTRTDRSRSTSPAGTRSRRTSTGPWRPAATSWDLYNHMLIPTLYDDDIKEYWHLVEQGHAVGRGGGTPGGDHRPRRRAVHAAPDAA